MSLMGIDVGTTGCKAAVFSEEGALLGLAYREYAIDRPAPGHAELDARRVWHAVKTVIAEAAAQSKGDPVRGLSIASLGEAVVPVSAAREILGPSLLNADARGAEFLPELEAGMPRERLYTINGNTPGNHYSLTKLLWTRRHAPEIYEQTHKFFHWAALVAYLLGGEATVDFSLANRTLLFDVDREDWSAGLLQWSGVDPEKLPKPVASGTITGTVSLALANELGLPSNVAIVAGGHDQCLNALGCGALHEGEALFGMGTFFCIAPVFARRPEPGIMMRQGLNTEHHAAPGRFLSFIYNDGGSLVQWYRNTFAAQEHAQALREGRDIYPQLLEELPATPSSILVLPHFSPTGPPEFIGNSAGAMLGLKLGTTRGDLLKGLMEGALFYLRVCLDALPEAGLNLRELRAAGGGSQSDAWLQLCADVFGKRIVRVDMPQAGTLGGAMLAGCALGTYASLEKAAQRMTHLGRAFDPNPAARDFYAGRFEQYQAVWPALRPILTQPGA